MTIIPAIDLREGKCVRLMQGDFGRMTVYSVRPAEVAEKWQEKGAERIHVVDLDGSRAGVPRNRDVIEEILQKVSVPVQVGGGIRNIETVKSYIEAGVRWVILGTATLKDRDFVVEACRLFGGKIILGIDGRDGKVAVEAWTEKSARSVEEVAASYRDVDLAAVIYTDIGRDGMERGVNVEATRRLAGTVGVPVIASGGVANLEDIKRIKTLERYGVVGVVVGKALYSGALSLEEAIEAGR